MAAEQEHATIFAALQAQHPLLSEERLAVVRPASIATAKQLDRLLLGTAVTVKFVHWAGRDAHEWLEIHFAVTGDTWVLCPNMYVPEIYWAWEKGDSFRYCYTGKDLPAFIAADTAVREAMSERGEFHPYADDISDTGFDLFG